VTTGGDDERERQREVSAVLVKVLGVAVAIGLVIGVGAWIMVKALGLNAGDASDLGAGAVRSAAPLPTTALPVPTASPPTDNPGLVTTTPAAPGTGDLYLSASPVFVNPMERINLTGQWPGHDNEGLLVQRFEGGQWADFGVQVRVNVGTFETYVMTGRAGDQKFRVYDPQTKTASNEITVTVGS
jgi:hypothetical protein